MLLTKYATTPSNVNGKGTEQWEENIIMLMIEKKEQAEAALKYAFHIFKFPQINFPSVCSLHLPKACIIYIHCWRKCLCYFYAASNMFFFIIVKLFLERNWMKINLVQVNWIAEKSFFGIKQSIWWLLEGDSLWHFSVQWQSV